MAKRSARPILLDSGGDASPALAPRSGALIADCRGPEGVCGGPAGDVVAAAIAAPTFGPPLESHVVPGDRVALALAGVIPQREAVMEAVRRCLEAAGIQPADISVVDTAPERDTDTSYLAADEDGVPCYLARPLVDADVVIAIGAFTWDASLGGRSLAGELWPHFSRPSIRNALVRRLARRGRRALARWRDEMQRCSWNLGVMADLRLLQGRDGSLTAAVFGLPNQARRAIRRLADPWRPVVAREARLTIASLSRPLEGRSGDDGLFAAARAVAAAARVTVEDGTICLAGRLGAQPGVVFTRWRQGAPLQGLVHEAVDARDPALIADALQTRLVARALGDRRLVLFADLDEAVVEDLEFGHAGSAAAVERLAAQAESLVVLHEADLMLPRVE